MTSPIREIDIECPNCGTHFAAGIRESINGSLGEDWTDTEIEAATSAECPCCNQRLGYDVLLVQVRT